MGDVGNSRILINTCRRKIENPDEANILVIIVSENIHQWVLKSVGQSLQRNTICIQFQKIC